MTLVSRRILKSRARDAVVDVVTNQAEEHLGHDAARKLRGLRSDAGFLKAFDEGLQRALQRFVVEYEEQDEDLAAAIAEDPTIFENKEVQDALLTMLKRPGTYLVDEREQIVQTFASVLPTRKKRDRVDRAVTYLLRCLAEELWHLPELQPVYSLHFQKGSYETLRQQLDLQKAQLMALSEINVGLRDALLQLTDAIGAQKLLPPPPAVTLSTPSQVLHNLPQPDYGQFIGREEEFAQITRILRPYPHSQSHLVTIDGIGGIGKSALALEVAYHYLYNYDQLPPAERFDAIVWTTAKRTVLTGDGIVTRRQILRNLDDLYTAVAIALQREDITRARSEEQDLVVRQALVRQRTLIIVDNLETVDDEQVLTFLRELPAPTKAIVTTRHRIDVAYPVRLMGMPWEDMRILIAHECERKRVSLSADQASRLYTQTGGVPLAIVWSIAQMGFGYEIDTILSGLSQPVSDVARYCFVGSVSSISGQPAETLLSALSLFATDAARDALGVVADVTQPDRDDGLVVLERLSLVNKSGDRFSLLPLTSNFVKLSLQSHAQEERILNERYINYFLSVTLELGGESTEYGPERLHQFALLDRDLPNIQLALEQSYQREMWSEVGQFAAALAEFLDHRGLWKENIAYAEMGVDAARKTNNLRIVMRLKNFPLGWSMIVRFKMVQEGAEAIEEALRLARQLNDRREYAIALRNLGQVYRSRGQSLRSIPLFDESRHILAELGDHRQETIAIGNLGGAYRDLGEIDKSIGYAKEAIAKAQSSRNLDLLGLSLRRLADGFALEGKYEEARDWALQSLTVYQELDSPRKVARVYLTLAAIEIKLGQLEEARQRAAMADQIYRDLGRRGHLQSVEQILSQIEDANQLG